MTATFTGTLRGPAAAWGMITSSELVRLLQHAERALARAAGHELGRPVRRTGRRESPVASASRLIVQAIHDRGSLVAEFRLPDSGALPDGFEFDIESLAERSVLAALETAAGHDETRQDVAAAFADLIDDLDLGGATRFSEVEWTYTDDGPPVTVVLTGHDRDRLRRIAGYPLVEQTDGRVIGTIVAVDFEDHTGRARTPTGDEIPVRFDSSLDDDVEDHLRRPADLEGELTLDARSGEPRSLRVRHIAEQQALWPDRGDRRFWQEQTLRSFSAARDELPATDFEAVTVEATEEDAIAFLSAIR